MEKESKLKFPSSHCTTGSEEREVTVSLENLYIPGITIAAFLKRFCTVVRNPTKMIDNNGFWTGKWSVIVRLRKDPSDGLMHLPERLTMGNSEALITYSDMPQICKGSASNICQTTGQKSKDCPRKTTSNLQNQASHIEKECPKKKLNNNKDKMTALPFIPIEMREELLAGVNYIKTLANRFQKLDPAVVEFFGEKLTERLCQKYTGHWYPEKPIKGQAYRCIRINKHDKDESILEACAQSGLKYHQLALPKEMTLWIDPYEVSCRLGEESYPYTVASFDPRTTRLPDASSRHLAEQQQLSRTTPEEDSSTGISSHQSSPSLKEEDSDSGIDASSDGTTSPPMLSSFLEEQISWNPTVNQASTAVFRTSSPLWIPAWRAPQFYHNLQADQQHVFWM